MVKLGDKEVEVEVGLGLCWVEVGVRHSDRRSNVVRCFAPSWTCRHGLGI